MSSKECSDRKIAANRENAKKSTGPRTEKGKARARLNAETHGVFARRAILEGPPNLENGVDFLAILEGLREHYRPVGVHEDFLVQEIAVAKWKTVRLERYETAGISARLSATMVTLRSRIAEERWAAIPNGVKAGSARDVATMPWVTAQMVRDQIDLVESLRDGKAIDDDDPDFLNFVWATRQPSEGVVAYPETPEEVAEALKDISALELEVLKTAFRARAESLLENLYDLRRKYAEHEAALERVLVPEDTELEKLMRYSAHLSRLEERKVAMLERLQQQRRERERLI